jgi:hypothetical protein
VEFQHFPFPLGILAFTSISQNIKPTPVPRRNLKILPHRALRVPPAFFLATPNLLNPLPPDLGKPPIARQTRRHALFINQLFDTSPLRGTL